MSENTMHEPQPLNETQNEDYTIPGSDRFFTIPTVGMTLPRAAIGAALPFLARSGKNTAALTVIGAISDKETPVADLVDKIKPEWGLGRSVPGADADYKADYAFGVGSVAAAMLDKRSQPIHRVAAAINASKFVSQGAWAVSADKKHRELTGEPLKTKVGKAGKAATFLAMTSSGANTLSREMEPRTKAGRTVKKALGYVSLTTAGGGLILSEVAKHQNDKQFREKVGLPPKASMLKCLTNRRRGNNDA